MVLSATERYIQFERLRRLRRPCKIAFPRRQAADDDGLLVYNRLEPRDAACRVHGDALGERATNGTRVSVSYNGPQERALMEFSLQRYYVWANAAKRGARANSDQG